jgi:tetratricopeptide (TPR) repeat protein
MKRFLIVGVVVILFVGALLLTLFTKTTTANADIAAGNQAYNAQDYDTALQHYTTAQSQAPDHVEPSYNAGNTYYRRNALEQAQQTLEQTLSRPGQTLAESIHFNLGNIAYTAQQFDVAIGHYEEALRLNPADREAKYNLELALQQQQQQQNQQNQDQNQQDQQQNQDQNQQNQQHQDQNQQNQQNQDQDRQNQSGGQQDQQQNQQGQQGDQKDQQQGQQGDQQDQQDQQGQPGNQPQQQQADQQDGQAVGARPQKGLTPEQAKRLLAAIGGKSKTLMEQLQMMYYAAGGYPEKDW